MSIDQSLEAIRSVTARTQQLSTVSVDKVAAFLRRQLDLGGTLVEIEYDSRKRSSGASSGTQLLDAIVKDPSGTNIRRRLVFRYDLGGTFFRQYDLIPQFKVMRALETSDVPAPKALWLDAGGEIAGHPGLFMERVEAPAPGGQPFAEGPIAQATAAERREMIESSINVFAKVHRVDASQSNLQFLRERGSGDHFIARSIDWDTKELLMAIPAGFGDARAKFYDHVRAVMSRVRETLLSRAPWARSAELIHGDTNLSNVMFDGTRVAALLDWELCQFGLGEADLGYCQAGMSHFLSTLESMDGIPSDEELLKTYVRARGKAADVDYCRLWGEWRLGVYQVMAYSRFPTEMQGIEEMYWDRIENILSQFVNLGG